MMESILKRYPILMAILFALLLFFALYMGMQDVKSARKLAQHSEVLSLAEISQRMQGGDELKVEIKDGEIDCSTLNYLEITYTFSREIKAYVLISNREKNTVLYTFFDGTPSCDELKANPITGLVTRFEAEAIEGMFRTNLMGIRRYQNAQIFRFCGNCTQESKTTDIIVSFGLAALFFLGFLFSLYYQWKLWSEED